MCLNSDQDPNVSCRDFDVSYLCPSGSWTDTYWNHTVNSNGGDDHEERSYSNNAIVAACGGKQPVGIRARYLHSRARRPELRQIVIGPNDRLARMSQYGLTCNNSEQPDGQCSNYVTRYQGCVAKPATENHRLSDVFTGKFLTASSSTNGAAVKNTASASTRQTWAIEHVTNTEYVRLKNTTTGTYLNVTSSAEQAMVVTSTGSSATSQMWTIESGGLRALGFPLQEPEHRQVPDEPGPGAGLRQGQSRHLLAGQEPELDQPALGGAVVCQ